MCSVCSNGVARLKTEVAALKAEIAFLKGEQGDDTALTEDEQASLYSAAKLWVQNADDAAPFDFGAFTVCFVSDPQPAFRRHVACLFVHPQSTRIHCAFSMLRRIAKEGGTSVSAASGGSGATTTVATTTPHGEDPALISEVKQLRAQLQQRDNEIAILVNMVKQSKGATPVPPPSAGASFEAGPAAVTLPPLDGNRGVLVSPVVAGASSVGGMLASGDYVDPAILADRDKAMDVFMASYPKAQVCITNGLLCVQAIYIDFHRPLTTTRCY